MLIAFQELVEPRKQDANSLQWFLPMGRCVELYETFFLVSDDIMDLSLTWSGVHLLVSEAKHRLDVINDAMLL